MSKVIGRIIIWVGGILSVLTILFAIWQPLIWEVLFGKKPPAILTDSGTLASLITLMVALLALGVGAFGLAAYQLLERSLTLKIREEALNESKWRIARMQGVVAFGGWRTWLLSWRVSKIDHELLSWVILIQTQALDLISGLKAEEFATKQFVNQQKSNLAGYIVFNLRVHKDQIEQREKTELLESARRYSKQAYDEASRFGDNYDWKASYAAVLRLFPATPDNERKASEIISEIQERHQKGEVTTQEMKEYRLLFGLDDKQPR
ncbi:hypothetical protein MYX75_04740 [Acidobacteria bacterium AH-259-A15]|nr:hypothetical protein [Acidobacteria bacterium AH-259-A15]